MQTVATEFTDYTFHYQQVMREGNFAIYRKTHKAAGIVYYELIRVRERPAKTWPNGIHTPAREFYPSAKAWGRDGWTFYTLAEAQQHLAALQEEGAPHAN